MPTLLSRAAVVVTMLAGSSLLMSTEASAQVVPDCAGPAAVAEPGTAAYLAADAANIFCTQQRHLDQAQHPVTPLPLGAGSPLPDAYRNPARHDDIRFRYDTTTVDGLPVEVYRPCAPATCDGLPPTLDSFAAPYPAVISFHGGASNEKLHWWSSQMLAEAGYLVLSYKSAGVSPVESEAKALTDWLFARSDPLTRDFDGERLGIAGHSAGGVLVSKFGQADKRVDAVVSWDRAQSTVQPTDPPVRTPSLYMFADYNCQQSPVCQPTPSPTPPDPEGPGTKGQDFQLLEKAGVDTMQIALRAALHLDWTVGETSGNRYAEAMSTWYTTAWFDRYVRGATDPAAARAGFVRLTAQVYDDYADRRNISQGLFDPAKAAAAGDPFAGNVPYTIAGMPAVDRLSYRFRSKCFLTDPDSRRRAESPDLRATPCAVSGGRAPGTSAPRSAQQGPAAPLPAGPGLPATGGQAPLAACLLLLTAVATRRLSRNPASRRLAE